MRLLRILCLFYLSSHEILLVNAFSTSAPTTSSSSSLSSATAAVEPKYKTPIIICPGFGNDSIDYDTPLSQPPSKGLKTILSTKGFDINSIYTVPIQRSDWIRVAGGLFDIPNFYLNKARPDGLGYGWYLKRLKECVDLAYEESGGEKVMLIGHSAGGWLARAAMGDGVWSVNSSSGDGDDVENEGNEDIIKTRDKIQCLVTLGAIHKTPDDDTTCVTRGALKFVEENYPGAYLQEDGIKYFSVGGKAIVGSKEEDQDDTSKTDADQLYATRGEGSAQKVAFTSYEAVCGNGNTIGDGVVPLEWSMLDGAKQIELDGCLHSINEAGTTIPTDRWYGSEKGIDRWLPLVLDDLGLEGKSSSDVSVGFGGLQQWASNFFK